jgi:type IV secretion system protein TrbI
MPELDTTPSEGIDLVDPVPQGRGAISSRLRYSLWAFGIAMGLIIVGGMMFRLIKKGADDKAKQTAQYASEPATSNRQTVEKRQANSETATPASNPKQQPEPVAAANDPGAATSHPELEHAPDNQVVQSTPPSPQVTMQEQAQRDAERQAYQEEIAARKAPTSYQAYIALTSAGAPGATQGLSPASSVPDSYMPSGLPPPSVTGLESTQQGSPNDLAALGKKLGLVRTSTSTPGNYSAQNAQGEKSDFLSGTDAPNRTDDYLKATRVDPLSEFEIQQGSVIPAVMPLGVNSDTPAQVAAEIRVDVNDALCGVTRKDGSVHCYVLIPHGSKLVGEYNSNVSYGQNRVQVVWTRVIFPDSSSLDLGRMSGHSADGSAGLKDKVDDHWKSKIAGIALTSVLSAGLAVSQNRSNNSVLQYPSTGQVIGASVGQSASQLGQELTQRNFNRQPTLVIRPGQKFLVYVKKDIVFPSPYEPHY